jgi:hypothetical protein
MSTAYDEMIKSGRKLLQDTKTPALKKKDTKTKSIDTPIDSDPHKVMIRRTIQEKPKKKELIEDFQKFITAEEQF